MLWGTHVNLLHIQRWAAQEPPLIQDGQEINSDSNFPVTLKKKEALLDQFRVGPGCVRCSHCRRWNYRLIQCVCVWSCSAPHWCPFGLNRTPPSGLCLLYSVAPSLNLLLTHWSISSNDSYLAGLLRFIGTTKKKTLCQVNFHPFFSYMNQNRGRLLKWKQGQVMGLLLTMKKRGTGQRHTDLMTWHLFGC